MDYLNAVNIASQAKRRIDALYDGVINPLLQLDYCYHVVGDRAVSALDRSRHRAKRKHC